MTASFHLTNEITEIQRLSSELLRFSEAAGLAPDTVGDIRLALEEVVSNICRYGYERDQSGRIEVRLQRWGEAIRIEVRDDGRPFNPLSEAPSPNLVRPFPEREVGGLGIYLVRRVMDQVAYRFEHGQNVFIMEKAGGGHFRGRETPEGEDMPLRITSHEKQPGVMVVTPSGSLDTTTYSMLDERLAGILEAHPHLLVLDMEHLDYISSIGISTILKARKAMQKIGGRLTLMQLQPQVRKVFDIINALPSQPIFSSTEELDAYLDRMQRDASGGDNPIS